MDSPRWLITTLKGVYVVENFLLGWSPRLRSSPPVAARRWDGIYTGTLENYKSLLKPVRCRHTDHHQRDSLFTSAIPRNSATMQNHLRRHLPTSLELSILLQTTLLNYSTSKNPIYLLYSPTLQPNFIRYQSPVKPSHTPLEAGISVKTNSQRPHRSVGSTRRISPPEGWRMEPRTQIHLEIEESW